MPASTPEEIPRLFQRYVREGDLESVLALYEPDAAFLNQSARARHGLDELKEELAPLVAAKTVFEYHIDRVVHAGEIALTHTHWIATSPHAMSAHAVEVARRQPDGSWRWLIGDPFTIAALRT